MFRKCLNLVQTWIVNFLMCYAFWLRVDIAYQIGSCWYTWIKNLILSMKYYIYIHRIKLTNSGCYDSGKEYKWTLTSKVKNCIHWKAGFYIKNFPQHKLRWPRFDLLLFWTHGLILSLAVAFGKIIFEIILF